MTKFQYDRGIAEVERNMRAVVEQNIALNKKLKVLELKYAERGKTLKDVTRRYMERSEIQAKLDEARKDLEEIIKDTAELNVYIETTLQKKQAPIDEFTVNEWLVLVKDIRKRLNALLEDIR